MASAQLQLGQEIWGLRSALIRDNLRKFLTPQSRGLVYVLKVGLCAHFSMLEEVLQVPDRAEMMRRLNLGMLRLTQEQYTALLRRQGSTS